MFVWRLIDPPIDQRLTACAVQARLVFRRAPSNADACGQTLVNGWVLEMAASTLSMR